MTMASVGGVSWRGKQLRSKPIPVIVRESECYSDTDSLQQVELRLLINTTHNSQLSDVSPDRAYSTLVDEAARLLGH